MTHILWKIGTNNLAIYMMSFSRGDTHDIYTLLKISINYFFTSMTCWDAEVSSLKMSSEIKKSTLSYLQSMIELNYAWSTAIITWGITSCDARWLRSNNWIISLALSQLRSSRTSHYWNYSHWVYLELYVR